IRVQREWSSGQCEARCARRAGQSHVRRAWQRGLDDHTVRVRDDELPGCHRPDTLVKSPIDTAKTLFTSSRTVYDLADRPTLTQTFGPAVSFAIRSNQLASTQPETLTVATVYDSGGLVRRVTRTAQPDTAHLGSLVTRMGYDPAGRKVADTATDGAA